MKALTSVLIVEPSEIICEGLRSLLQQTDAYNVLAPMSDASALVERLPVVRPDLLIINPTLLSAPAQQLASIAAARPGMPVVALVYQYIEPSRLAPFAHSIDIRALRSTIVQTLQQAIETDEMPSPPSDTPESYELSDREIDVLVLVARGLSSKEIAEHLHISVHTVSTHRKNITHKTGIRSVAGLAVYAMIHNLMED